MLSAMAPHGREMSHLRKKIMYLHKKGEGYKKISKALLISQNTVAKWYKHLKRWNCNHLTETSRSSTEVNTSSGVSSDEKGWRKSTCKFTTVIQRSRKPNWGDYFPWHNMAYTAKEWHAWVPSTKEAFPKAQAQKSPPRVCQGPCWQRWRLLGLYTLEWWDQDKCFWNWCLQNCMASQRWGI